MGLPVVGVDLGRRAPHEIIFGCGAALLLYTAIFFIALQNKFCTNPLRDSSFIDRVWLKNQLVKIPQVIIPSIFIPSLLTLPTSTLANYNQRSIDRHIVYYLRQCYKECIDQNSSFEFYSIFLGYWKEQNASFKILY